jgi:ribosomal protein S7
LLIKQGLKFREKFDPFLIFLVSMMKITPNIVLISHKKSGIIHGVPFPISARKQITFSVKWVLKLLKDSDRVVKVSRIIDLLISSIYNRGISIKRKKEVYRNALRNRHLIGFYR